MMLEQNINDVEVREGWHPKISCLISNTQESETVDDDDDDDDDTPRDKMKDNDFSLF